MKHLVYRLFRVMLGLLLYALGSYLVIQANVGLGAWEAFGVGVSGLSGISYGDVIVYSGLIILGIDCLLKEKVGVATLLNTLLIGKFVDMCMWLGPVPTLTGFIPGLFLLFLGQVSICVGTYFYVGAGLGAGPRDSLMVALGKRLTRAPIGLVRGLLEGTVLLVGWALGAKVGVGTVISIFGIGFILQATFRLLHFDVKAVVHEDALATLSRLGRGLGWSGLFHR